MVFDPTRAASPTNIKLESGQQQLGQSLQPTRGRRKRVAIEIPAELELENMDPKDVKKLKNRIAAARLRERSQQQIRELQSMVAHYKARAEYLEGITARCAHCSCLPSEQLQFQYQHQTPHSAAGSPCHSPASSTEDDLMDGDEFAGISLSDIDFDVLSKMLLTPSE
ncbi:hypothetical protein Gpo141_00013965 [Globisporangium polare]